MREVLRGRGHAIASAFAAYSEHNYYRRVRLRHDLVRRAGRPPARQWRPALDPRAGRNRAPADRRRHPWPAAGRRESCAAPARHRRRPANTSRPIGFSDSGHSRPVGLHVADARHHVHILGATGSGKSELMARMILDDAEAGRGVVVVDPKGDLVSDILMRLPEELGEKVVLFDADSKARPPVLNPLEGTDKARAVDNLVSIFSRIYASSWGPRTDDILRAGLLTLTAMPGTPTLVDLPKLLTVPAFRQRACDQIDDEVLKGFWSWYDDLSEANRAQVIAPLMNKVRGFLLRPFVRAAIAGGESTVDMDEVLNNGGICLVRIARDALGMETARLVGSIVVARTWQAATRRARIPKRQRRDCGLVHRRVPQLPEPGLPAGGHARRGPRLPAVHDACPPVHRPAPEGARRGHQHQRSIKDLLQRLAGRRQTSGTAHDATAFRSRPVQPRRLPCRRPPCPRRRRSTAFTAVTEKLRPAIPGRAKAIRKAAKVNTRPSTSPTPRGASTIHCGSSPRELELRPRPRRCVP